MLQSQLLRIGKGGSGIHPPVEMEGKLLSYHQYNMVETLKPDCLHSASVEDYLFPSLYDFGYLVL